MSNYEILLLLYLIFAPFLLLGEDNFFEIKTMRYYKKITHRDVLFWKHRQKRKIPYVKIEFSLQKTQNSKSIYTRMYFYDKSKKLLTKSCAPFKIKIDDKLMDKLPTVINSKDDIEMIFLIPVAIIKKITTIIFVLGDSRGANISIYPKNRNFNDFEYPEKKIIETLHSVKRATFIDPVIEHKVETDNPRQPQITFFLRYPVGITDSKKLNGVLAMSLLGGSAKKIKSQLQNLNSKNEVGGLIRFAQENKLVVLCWTSTSLWNPRKNWNEQPRKENHKQDKAFDEIAKSWSKGVNSIIRKYNIPSRNYLLWGISGSAQYAARLALREPQYFSAIHIHIPSSFDLPTTKAKYILWCLTTGENEIGYQRSLKFLDFCKRKRYAIMYKAIPGLSHRGHYQSNKIGIVFFSYVLAQYKNYYEKRYSPVEIQKKLYKDFYKSPYIGDIINQRVYNKDDAIFVSKKYKTYLPSYEIRNAWETK